MAPRTKGASYVFEAFTTTKFNAHVCRSCRNTLSKRTYASSATAQISSDSSAIEQHTEPTEASHSQPRTKVKAGIVLSRPPLITPDPHPFETAFYLYQRRLNERLVLPFTQYFYFRRGTPAFDQWRTRRRARGGAATRDIGNYNAYDQEGWNDEVLIGDESAKPSKIIEALVEEEGRSTEFVDENQDAKLAGLRRTTEADAANNQKSLERSLGRTLYLLVKSKPRTKDQPENTLWQFPSGTVEGKEGLREAAQRVLGTSCGVNMNTWMVGNHPVGHFVQDPKQTETEQKKPKSNTEESQEIEEEEKTFFMKARIMAGQAELSRNEDNTFEDFKWLAKEEVEKTVHPGYWSRVKNMLVAQ